MPSCLFCYVQLVYVSVAFCATAFASNAWNISDKFAFARRQRSYFDSKNHYFSWSISCNLGKLNSKWCLKIAVLTKAGGGRTLKDVVVHLHKGSVHHGTPLVELVCRRVDLAKWELRILITQFSGTERTPRALPPSCEFYVSVWRNDFSGTLPIHTEGSVRRVIKVLKQGVYELMVKGLLSPPLSTSAMTYCPLTAIFLINFAHLKVSSLNTESTILFKLALAKEVAVQSRGGHDMTV